MGFVKKKIKLLKLKNIGEKQKQKLLRKQLAKEVKLVRSISLKVLHEFEKLGYQEMALKHPLVSMESMWYKYGKYMVIKVQRRVCAYIKS